VLHPDGDDATEGDKAAKGARRNKAFVQKIAAINNSEPWLTTKMQFASAAEKNG
jgi:hypothetical protein